MFGHVQEGVDTNDICRSERRARGPTHRLANDLVHLFNGITVGHHRVDDVHDAVDTDAVGYEIGGVLAVNDTFA